jgi:hypothetical protein
LWWCLGRDVRNVLVHMLQMFLHSGLMRLSEIAVGTSGRRSIKLVTLEERGLRFAECRTWHLLSDYGFFNKLKNSPILLWCFSSLFVLEQSFFRPELADKVICFVQTLCFWFQKIFRFYLYMWKHGGGESKLQPFFNISVFFLFRSFFFFSFFLFSYSLSLIPLDSWIMPSSLFPSEN